MSAPSAAFTSGLDAKSLEAFSVACTRPFGEQAQFFLNAFWDESADQAENIYSVAFELIDRRTWEWEVVEAAPWPCDRNLNIDFFFK